MSSSVSMSEDSVNRIPKVGGKEKEIGTKFDWGKPLNTDGQVVTRWSLCTKKAKQMIHELDIAVIGSSHSLHELDDVQQVSIVENKGSRDFTSLEGYRPFYREHGASAVKRNEQVIFDNSRCYKFDSSDSNVWLVRSDWMMIADPGDAKLWLDELKSISEEFTKMCRIEKDKQHAYENFYRNMFNKMKSWILTTVIKVG